jgi:hypothetical protein
VTVYCVDIDNWPLTLTCMLRMTGRYLLWLHAPQRTPVDYTWFLPNRVRSFRVCRCQPLDFWNGEYPILSLIDYGGIHAAVKATSSQGRDVLEKYAQVLGNGMTLSSSSWYKSTLNDAMPIAAGLHAEVLISCGPFQILDTGMFMELVTLQ